MCVTCLLISLNTEKSILDILCSNQLKYRAYSYDNKIDTFKEGIFGKYNE